MHHHPFPTEDESIELTDGDELLETIKNSVDALIFGHKDSAYRFYPDEVRP
jgi:hypothetical protein